MNLGVAVLVGGDRERIGLAHDVVLLLFREVAEEYAVVACVWFQVFGIVSGQVEFNVLGETLHRPADVIRSFPLHLVSCVYDIEAPLKLDVAFDSFGWDRVCTVGDIVALNAPPFAFLLQEMAQRHNPVGFGYDHFLHPVEEELSWPSDEIVPDYSILIVPAVHDFEVPVAA